MVQVQFASLLLLFLLTLTTIAPIQCFVPNQQPITIVAKRQSVYHNDHRFTPIVTSTKLFLSSLVVDDNNNDPVIPPSSNRQQLQQQSAAFIDSSVLLPHEQQEQQLNLQQLQTSSISGVDISSSTLKTKWMNSGLTIGTLIAIMMCLISLDSIAPSGIWDSSNIQETVMKIPNEIWIQYSNVLTSHPIATKACTSATVYTIGDIIAQRTTTAASISSSESSDSHENNNKIELDKIRVLRSMIAGLIGHGPLSHYWYNICDHFFSEVIHLTAWWSFLPKVVVDQTIWGPIWNNTYLLLIGLMKMERLDTIWEDIKKSTVPMVVSGLKLWPAAHLITYGLIPNENRLLWVDMVEILWVTILSKQAASLDNDHRQHSTTTSIPNDSVVDELSFQQGK